MFRWLAICCLKLAAMFDESVSHQPNPDWCNVNNRQCKWKCKEICLDTPDCMRCGVSLCTHNIMQCQHKNTNNCPQWYFNPNT